MENEILTYEDKIGRMLLDLPEGDEFLIEKNVKPENRTRFIEVVKSYIDRHLGNVETPRFEIEISSDYKTIRKRIFAERGDSDEDIYLIAKEEKYNIELPQPKGRGFPARPL